ncbi:MAG: hypothetical protein IPH06_03300 [Alphaproteobacteria bacterium]|nr:hypothetical protein [Alphaproteobacteria bacterium]QQS57066.1 MAG: hypothetical protein IPN28_12550 [Alphaproteobacteria bacterium]
MLWDDILSLAVRTPSPHNVQPWKVVIHDESRATVYLDTGRTLPIVDDTGSFVLLSMAMFTESICLLATNRQHRVDITLVFSGFSDAPVIPYAELRLVSDPSVAGVYEDSLFLKRRTSRAGSLRKPVPAETIERFKVFFDGAGQSLGFTAEPEMIESLMTANIEALFSDLNDEAYYQELLEYLRFSEDESRQKRDGLDFRCMNMRGFELKGLTKFPALLRAPVFQSFLSRYYRQKLGHTEMMAWLSGPFWDARGAIAAGAPFMRFWLEMAREDLYLLPFGNLVTNPLANEKMSGLLRSQDIWIIFRLGYCDPPPESLRLSIREVILND